MFLFTHKSCQESGNGWIDGWNEEMNTYHDHSYWFLAPKECSWLSGISCDVVSFCVNPYQQLPNNSESDKQSIATVIPTSSATLHIWLDCSQRLASWALLEDFPSVVPIFERLCLFARNRHLLLSSRSSTKRVANNLAELILYWLIAALTWREASVFRRQKRPLKLRLNSHRLLQKCRLWCMQSAHCAPSTEHPPLHILSCASSTTHSPPRVLNSDSPNFAQQVWLDWNGSTLNWSMLSCYWQSDT